MIEESQIRSRMILNQNFVFLKFGQGWLMMSRVLFSPRNKRRRRGREWFDLGINWPFKAHYSSLTRLCILR